MDYTIIKPKTVYTITLKTDPEVYKCSGCGYANMDGVLGIVCLNPCGCYREFNTETKAREWLDKIEKYESSVDDGFLVAAGENRYNMPHGPGRHAYLEYKKSLENNK